MHRELGFVLAALALISGSAQSKPLIGPLLDPVTPACVSSPFGPRILPGKPLAGTYHNGLDLPAPLGEAVRAVAAGTLIRIEHGGPGGLQVLIQHPGFVGVYSHFGSIAAPLADGQRFVTAGEELGVVGLTGVTYGSHLYFEMKIDSRPVDPMPYLRVPLCRAAHHDGRSVTVGRDGRILPSRMYRTAGLARSEREPRSHIAAGESGPTSLNQGRMNAGATTFVIARTASEARHDEAIHHEIASSLRSSQ